VLEKSIAELGIFPAVELPLSFDFQRGTPEIVGQEHYTWPAACSACCSVQRLAGYPSDFWEWRIVPEDKTTVFRARKSRKS